MQYYYFFFDFLFLLLILSLMKMWSYLCTLSAVFCKLRFVSVCNNHCIITHWDNILWIKQLLLVLSALISIGVMSDLSHEFGWSQLYQPHYYVWIVYYDGYVYHFYHFCIDVSIILFISSQILYCPFLSTHINWYYFWSFVYCIFIGESLQNIVTCFMISAIFSMPILFLSTHNNWCFHIVFLVHFYCWIVVITYQYFHTYTDLIYYDFDDCFTPFLLFARTSYSS